MHARDFYFLKHFIKNYLTYILEQCNNFMIEFQMYIFCSKLNEIKKKHCTASEEGHLVVRQGQNQYYIYLN